MRILMAWFTKNKLLLGVILISILSVYPLFHSGLHPTHDGEYHVIRFYEFDKALRDGNIYPRWAQDLNNQYGVPLFNYVYPLPNYAGALLHAVGFSFIDSYKMSMVLASIIGSVFFFLWAKHFWKEEGAFVGAVCYTFVPYKFVDIFVRGSVGELWALAWFPAFLWAVTWLMKKDRSTWISISAIFLALTIFSHNILAVMFSLFSICYCGFLLVQEKKMKSFLTIVYVYLLASMLSAIFWLPALVETSYVRGLQIYSVYKNFADLSQLLIPSWGSAPFGDTAGNEMSVQIGLLNLVVVFMSVLVLFKTKDKKKKALFTFFLIAFIVSVFLMVSYSRYVWTIIPLFNYFQFPWRFLNVTILICSFLAGGIIYSLHSQKEKLFCSAVVIGMAITLSIGYTKPAYYHDRNDTHYLIRDNFIHGTNSPGDLFNTIWMQHTLPMVENRLKMSNGKIATDKMSTSYYRFTVVASKTTTATAQLAYFPGWKVYVDRKETSYTITKAGIFSFSIPKGKHLVELRFGDTMIRSIAKIVTIIGIVIVSYILFRPTKRVIRKKL